MMRYKYVLPALFIVVFSWVTFGVSASQRGEHELIIQHNDLVIAGTLALPESKSTDALVIMLSGSGPQERDQTLDGFKVFKELAGQLQAAGIPSFRFDDRGVDASTGNFGQSTLNDHASDVLKIISYLKQHQRFRFESFVLLGHSQGSIVAAHVATKSNDVKKLVLMGPPSVPLIDILLYQVRQEHLDKSLAPSLVESVVQAHNGLLWAINQNKDLSSAEATFAEATRKALLTQSIDVDTRKLEELVGQTTSEHKLIYGLPSLTSFLYHDTAKDYESLQIPVLALFGGKDLQVTIAQNKDVMDRALLRSGTHFEFETFDNANHFFQAAVTGQRAEYSQLEKSFVPGFAESISSWILR
ncbi:alpha/beta hydrolase family protein [Alteromonas sp. CYL-A6]|uniref:alpha/beta hydrolase family protein n=1 Tax=Alteromonas nitratireducens TaxID=3390813 RepID=UPI0034C486A1